MLEVWIIDDSRADRGILSLLLNEMEGVLEIREFSSGSEVLKFLDLNSGKFSGTKFLVLCDSHLGADSGEIILTQISLQIKNHARYQILMSGIAWDEEDWNSHEAIDNFMEKKSDLDIWRSELERIVKAARNKLL